mmetsp:Transcript_49895/g.154146  ORF Transcript_49895/g.154146 Transcript_49895/m.154146 type:complete len:206 (-) Transcript_49895:101-718(-)
MCLGGHPEQLVDMGKGLPEQLPEPCMPRLGAMAVVVIIVVAAVVVVAVVVRVTEVALVVSMRAAAAIATAMFAAVSTMVVEVVDTATAVVAAQQSAMTHEITISTKVKATAAQSFHVAVAPSSLLSAKCTSARSWRSRVRSRAIKKSLARGQSRSNSSVLMKSMLLTNAKSTTEERMLRPQSRTLPFRSPNSPNTWASTRTSKQS